ncbi:two-component system response regulator [Janthinobacterium agaricidamnosum]|uniref:Sensory box protein n=1 Tax=Janthinobacterium agaricidamnosum NBRC 102515 = DSM 9628 TaxID=1349767 RepID=W0V7F4_9BURK|nr:EAL domain-containing protein [Janthinobacterium agaricidamnosum]CDG83510.1 sensory box protein [Janthinobacterium agaricidamnosum NBRC 102515 = DSM 9628]
MHRDLSEPHTKGEILIVEDSPASLKLLSDLLGGAGYAVRQAPNGELALWSAQAHPPELILLDVRMPGIDGFEVCRRLKESEQLRHVPVIFLSAQHDTGDKLRGFELGAVDFIAKPFQVEEILARADAHVRLCRAQRQLAAERTMLEQRVAERTAELEQVARDLAQEAGARRANEELLRLSAQVFEATQDAIVITTPDRAIVASNRAFTRITGYSAQEALGRDIATLAAENGDDVPLSAMEQGLRAGGHWYGEVLTRRKSGDIYPCLLSVSKVLGPDGAVINYITAFLDISERKAEQRLIDFLSYHDALTGLPNRLLANERFEQARAAALRDGRRVVVMCLDLDRFKSINDSFGPPVADKALRAVAKFIGSCLRTGDTVARQGGDEFQVILQDDAQMTTTLAVAQKILQGLREELSVDGHRMVLTTSIGIAQCPNDGMTLDDLLRKADTALVRAKETGRDNYAFFTERMDIDVRARLAVQQQLRGAVARDEFTVHYQPQVCLRSGAMLGAEALLRWDSPVLGKVSPAMFIPLAEEYGLINAIGEWVLETVCGQMRRWHDDGLGQIKVAVNLSGNQFAQDRTVQFVEATLRGNGIPASCLGIEITESTVMGDPDKAVAALKRLKDIGVSISLDDFGTGYSSLGYLKRFPIDVLKIDKSFVDDVTTSTSDAAIALSVISLAHNLNMRVIAEGVETRAQVAFLAEHGCDEMQGYYFSRPLEAVAFTELLREQKNLYAV